MGPLPNGLFLAYKWVVISSLLTSTGIPSSKFPGGFSVVLFDRSWERKLPFFVEGLGTEIHDG